MAATIELANLGFRFKTNPTFNQTQQRPLPPLRSFVKPSLGRNTRPNLTCRVVEEQVGVSFSREETSLIDAIIGVQGRGRSASPRLLQEIDSAVKALEISEGISNPTSSDLIEGRWQLMFTTRPGSASPIQRTFVGVDFFTVFQEVYLQTKDPRVSNIVKFSDAIGELKVEAAASVKDAKRILFRFDKAAFSLKFLPFKVPYPVPFRLLGDEAKGWLDTTYLSESGNLRISRGNKGTTFVLQKIIEPRQRLLSAISRGVAVREAIDEFLYSSKNAAKGEAELLEGEWQMIWSSQNETDSWIENAANGLMGSQIVKPGGELKFIVKVLFGLRFSITGTFVKTGSNMYEVKMDDGAFIAGQYGIPVELQSEFNLEVLYSDEKLRITKGYSKIVFVHLRV